MNSPTEDVYLASDESGNKGLIAAIIIQAFRDATQCRNPQYSGKKAIEKEAFHGRKFFDIDNKVFCAYCYLIDIDPFWLEKKATQYFNDFDRGKKPSFRKYAISLFRSK